MASTSFSINITFKLNTAGYIWCNPLAVSVLPTPRLINSIMTLSSPLFVRNSLHYGNITMYGVNPGSFYNIYCITKSTYGVQISYDNIISTAAGFPTPIKTLCCKSLEVIFSSLNLLEKKDQTNVFSLALQFAPAIQLSILFSVYSTSAPINASLALNSSLPVVIIPQVIPNTISLSLNSFPSDLIPSLAMLGGSFGQYTLNITLSGPSASEYALLFPRGFIFNVFSKDSPPLPLIKSVQFSDDGSSIYVRFDSDTDCGTFPLQSFSCKAIFSFPGDSISQCQWINLANAIIYVGRNIGSGGLGRSVLLPFVNDMLLLLPNSIKSACTILPAKCVYWNYMEPASYNIDAPIDATAPVVSISAPTVIGSCDSLLLDFSGSRGSAGRPWQSFVFNVISPLDISGAANISIYLNTFYVFSPPTLIPRSMFISGNSYTVFANFCNFLLKCSFSKHVMTVLDEMLPLVSISAPPHQDIFLNGVVSFASVSSITTCNLNNSRNSTSTTSTVGLISTWQVALINGTQLVKVPVSSLSINPFLFILPSYSLSKNNQYKISVFISSTIYGRVSSASVTINVLSSSIVAIISGSMNKMVNAGNSIVLDASPSYDNDVSPSLRSSPSHFIYSWSCMQILPIQPLCTVSLPDITSSYSPLVSISTDITALETTSILTLTIFQGLRYATQHVQLYVTNNTSPILQITSAIGNHINPGAKLNLMGSVFASSPVFALWSVNDPTIDLHIAALSHIHNILSVNRPSMILLLPANLLIPFSSYTFTLQCTLRGSNYSSSIIVSVNGPPSPGIFSVTPSVGTELQTMFYLTANNWIDSDHPITYSFGFLTPNNIVLMIQGSSEKSYGQSFLPAGNSNKLYSLYCQLQIFDSLGANASSLFAVNVYKLHANNQQVQSLIISNLAASSNNIDGIKQVISLASSIVNYSNCTLAPNCVHLFRSQCELAANTCGQCLPGYAGQLGNGNSLCKQISYNQTFLDRFVRNTVGSKCKLSKDCGLWQFCDVHSKICVVEEQSCPNACSGFGACYFADSNIGVQLASCKLGNPNCVAVSTFLIF